MNENRTTARLQRMVHHKEIFENQECSEFEAMLYISTVTLEHPPNHDWDVIYGWLFKRWSPEQAATIFDEYDIPPELNEYPQREQLTLL